MKIRANKNSLIGVLVAAMVAGPLVSIPAAASGGGGTVSGGSGGSGGGGGGGGGSSGGGGGGGGGTVCDTTPVLPTLAPFPDIILRESFGYGQGVRPAGGNGCNKPYFVHNSIAGFWVEYPGNKNTGWLAPADVETWNVCASGDPDELPSPLQAGTASGGCLISNWTDPVITRPTALVPFTPPATAYQMSIEAWPAPVDADYYLGFGLTDNSVLDSNLETSAGVWLELRANAVYATTSTYALRANGRTGPILAWGTTPWSASTHLVLRYDPVTQSVSASVEGVELGSFVQPIKAPRFIGIEGVGQVDNLVVRKLQ